MSASPTTFTGNLTSDPDLKFMDSGTAKLSFSVACNHYWTGKDGDREEKTSFFNCVAWRQLAEDAANVLEKGMGKAEALWAAKKALRDEGHEPRDWAGWILTGDPE